MSLSTLFRDCPFLDLRLDKEVVVVSWVFITILPIIMPITREGTRESLYGSWTQSNRPIHRDRFSSREGLIWVEVRLGSTGRFRKLKVQVIGIFAPCRRRSWTWGFLSWVLELQVRPSV